MLNLDGGEQNVRPRIVVKTMEFDWFVPTGFSGLRLTGEFFINGSVRIPGQAVLSQRGTDDPLGKFRGGTSPQLAVEFQHFQ